MHIRKQLKPEIVFLYIIFEWGSRSLDPDLEHEEVLSQIALSDHTEITAGTVVSLLVNPIIDLEIKETHLKDISPPSFL